MSPAAQDDYSKDSSTTFLANDIQLKKPKVIVIGAGAGGVRAADVLLRNGCDVQLLEARDRIGGRIAQSSALGKPVDLGPNWIHGTEGNPMVQLAEQVNASTTTGMYMTQNIYTPEGELLSEDDAEIIVETAWTAFHESIEYAEAEQDSIEDAATLYDFVKDRIYEKIENEKLRSYCLQVSGQIGGVIAGEMKNQSLKNMKLEKPIPGDDLFLASTYGPLLTLMAENISKTGCVHLGKLVKSITLSNNADEPCIISLDNEEQYKAQAVIVAVPLGCLKKQHIAFEPPIPKHLQQSIDSLGYGSLEKVYISFPSVFWSKDGPSTYSFLKKHFDTNSATSTWSVAALSLAHLPAPHNQPVLLFYIHGENARQINDLIQKYGVEHSKRHIVAHFEPYFSQIPGYNSSTCEPVDVIATNWLGDNLAGNGSYSNFPVGLTNGQEHIKSLHTGWEEYNCWFAGEHAGPLLGLACVSGAYWSGENAARKIIKKFGLKLVEGSVTEDIEQLFGEADLHVMKKDNET